MSRFVDIQLDEECLQRAADGDRAAQRRLYDQSAGPVFALIRRVVGDRSAAEDVFQDCMLSLLGHLPEYRGDAPFGAWARQIALRHSLMHLRSPWQRARRAVLQWMPGENDALDAAMGHDTVAGDPPMAELIDLERALQRLPAVARAVVWMHDAEGLTHEEIAASFGRTVSFSKSQLARAHASLRRQLDPGCVPAARGAALAAQEPMR